MAEKGREKLRFRVIKSIRQVIVCARVSMKEQSENFALN